MLIATSVSVWRFILWGHLYVSREKGRIIKNNWNGHDIIINMSEINVEKIISSFFPGSEWCRLDFTQESEGQTGQNNGYLGGKKREAIDQAIQYKCTLTWDKTWLGKLWR